MGIVNTIQKFVGMTFNFQFVKVFPRHSVRFAKKHFKGKPVIVAEIGTYKGHNALSILKELNVKTLYIIDPYKDYEEYRDREVEKDQLSLNKAYGEAKRRLKNYSSKIVFIRKHSEEAVKDLPALDFVYIDGNHTYKFVKSDIENYYPKIKEGGILAGHDITNKKFNLDIVKAVFEFSKKMNLVPFISRIDWWIVKGKKTSSGSR